jgi:excisionase family DNA binding protein
MNLLSAQEVAKLLGINETTVRLNAKNGKLPFHCLRVGSLWKFPKDEVMQFLYGNDWKEIAENENTTNA